MGDKDYQCRRDSCPVCYPRKPLTSRTERRAVDFIKAKKAWLEGHHKRLGKLSWLIGWPLMLTSDKDNASTVITALFMTTIWGLMILPVFAPLVVANYVVGLKYSTAHNLF